jgi:ribose transport system substrate-binding protein
VKRIEERIKLCLWPVVLAGMLAGCGGGSTTGTASSAGAGSGATPPPRPKVLFISNSNSDWWNAVEKGMQDGASKYGVEAILKRNDGQPVGQIKLLEEAAGMTDIQGVAVSVLDPNAPGIADAMKQVKDSGKQIITIDSDGGQESRFAYIGTNNRNAGIVAGKVAATLRPPGGKVAVFVGTAGAANALERHDGFFEGAGKAFEKIETFEDSNDPDRARSNVQTAISKYPDVGVLLGLWSYNAPAIAAEVGASDEVRKKVTVVTFDLDQRAVDDMEKGNIDASICQNPYEMGFQGVRLLKALITGDKATVGEMFPRETRVMDTGVRVIVPKTVPPSPIKGENVIDIDAMKIWLKGKGLQSS